MATYCGSGRVHLVCFVNPIRPRAFISSKLAGQKIATTRRPVFTQKEGRSDVTGVDGAAQTYDRHVWRMQMNLWRS